ncbi:MAG TPA: PTS sugar transporter subunit IIA [Hyphomicrobiaceae bacterium]
MVLFSGRRACDIGGSVQADSPSGRPPGMVTGAAVNGDRRAHAFSDKAHRPDAAPVVAPHPASAREAAFQAEPKTKLSELLGAQDILFETRSGRKCTSLGAIAVRLGEKVGRSQGSVLAALLRRERLGSTAIGNGTAMPHARLDGIRAPAAVLARLQRPLQFGTSDDDRVDLLLGLVWPKSDPRGFVAGLHHGWRLMRRSGLADLFRQSRTPAEALALIKSFEEEKSDARGHIGPAAPAMTGPGGS